MVEARDLLTWSDDSGEYPSGIHVKVLASGNVKVAVRSSQRREGPNEIVCPGTHGITTLPADVLRNLARKILAEV